MLLDMWAKTFFVIYKCLDRLAKTIDSYIEIRALSSCFKSLKDISRCTTDRIWNDMTDLMNKKITLINLKCLTEKLLMILPEKASRFVIMKYVEDKTYEEVAKRMDISLRTAMRWNNSVLEKSGKILKGFGYDHKNICKLIDNEQWILAVFNSVMEEEKNKHTTKLSYFVVLREAEKEYKTHLL